MSSQHLNVSERTSYSRDLPSSIGDEGSSTRVTGTAFEFLLLCTNQQTGSLWLLVKSSQSALW